MWAKCRTWSAWMGMPRGWKGLLEALSFEVLAAVTRAQNGGREFQLLEMRQRSYIRALNVVCANGTVSRLVLVDLRKQIGVWKRMKKCAGFEWSKVTKVTYERKKEFIDSADLDSGTLGFTSTPIFAVAGEVLSFFPDQTNSFRPFVWCQSNSFLIFLAFASWRSLPNILLVLVACHPPYASYVRANSVFFLWR